MSTTEQHPVFPLELFELVFQMVYLAPFGKNPSALEPCSLVCKTFAEICQPLIFEEISGIGISDGERERLLRLTDVLENKPCLLKSVRKLWFSFEFDEFDPSTNVVLSEAEWQRCQNIILSFPNLATLEIENRLVSPNPFPHLGDAAINLVKTYTSQPSLHRLFVEAFDSPYQDILSSRHLQFLRVGYLGPPPTIFPAAESSITRLTLEELDTFSLSFLTHLPHLKELELDGIIDLKVGPMLSNRCPSFKLEVLSIRFYLDIEGPLLSIFVDFYKTCAAIANVRPFDALQELVVQVSAKEDIVVLQSLLECTPNLQALSLDEQRYTFGFESDVFLLLTYVLGQVIYNSLPSLGCLSISMTTNRKERSASDMLMSYLVSMFNTISEHNVLNDLHFKISAGTDDFDLPSRYEWYQVGTLLGNPDGYPELEKVSVEIYLSPQPNYSDIIEAAAAGRDVFELNDMLRHSMVELLSGGDVEFSSSVHLRMP